MQGLQRRPSGHYAARIVVPPALRQALGRRELIASTGTNVRAVAVVIASEVLARWRRQLHELGRLVATNANILMDPAELLKIAHGSPALLADGHVRLVEAAAASGLAADALLRAAGDGLSLCWRASGVMGHLIAQTALQVDDAELGTQIVPGPGAMPAGAVRHRADGVLAVPAADVAAVANVLLVDPVARADLVAFDAPGRAGWLFVPDAVVQFGRGDVEVLAAQVEALRKAAAAGIAPAALEAARSAQKGEGRAAVQAAGKWAGKPFSEAVELYCSDDAGLPEKLASKTEQGQRRRGLMLFAEFMGDPVLHKIDGDMLRAFRDGPLKSVPANANHLPKSIKRATMPETIEALRADGREWPALDRKMVTERVRWLVRFFTWLHAREYLTANPAAGLKSETGITRAQLKTQQREDLGDDARGPFEPGELVAIFSVPTYRTGNGAHVTKGNERWRPFEYWLPLLGLLGGLRIREAAQLHLVDVVQREGIWCLDINEREPDKSLKTLDSRRIVPLHSVLIEAGFVRWCEALRGAGYRRVFPELSFAAGDAAYAKEAKRTMSAMLLRLGMPRDGKKTFHCLRHCANDALARVTDAAGLDEHMRRFVRLGLLGHKPGDDVNTVHYTSSSTAEKAAMIAGMKFDIPAIAAFDIAAGLVAVRAALDNKMGARRGREDLGPAA